MSDRQPIRRIRVDPPLVFGVSLLVALAINWKGFEGAMHGSADIVAVGVRFLVAVAVVWAGLFAVASLIASFAANTPAESGDATGDRRHTDGRAPASGLVAIDADHAAVAIAADTETAAG